MATRARGIPTPALKLRLAVLGVAVIGGLGLTYLLGSEISHQLTGSLVIDAAGGGRPITGLAVALVAAYLAGVTMILFPWGLAAIPAILPLVQEAKTRAGWVRTAGFYALGMGLVLLPFGALLGLTGGAIQFVFVHGSQQAALARVLYISVGVFALAYSLSELRFVKLPALPNPAKGKMVPAWVRRLGHHPRAILLGAFISGGFNVGWPSPLNWALWAWIVGTGSAMRGMLAEGVFISGVVTPLFVIGLLLMSGLRPRVISQQLVQRSEALHVASGAALVVLGLVSILHWGSLV